MTAKSMIKSHITLHYFNVRGRAEHIRYLFAAGGRAFDDRRYKWEEWQKFKPKTPFGSMPVLEIDGKLIGSSLTCGRVAAKITGLYGSGPIEQGRVDSVAETCNDLREALIAIPGKDKEGHEEALQALKDETITPTLTKLDKFLGDNSYFVGGKITWADIHFYAVLEVVGNYIPVEQLLADHPRLLALNKRVGSNPGIASYISKRPKTNF